jgi:hypothetical protein
LHFVKSGPVPQQTKFACTKRVLEQATMKKQKTSTKSKISLDSAEYLVYIDNVRIVTSAMLGITCFSRET